MTHGPDDIREMDMSRTHDFFSFCASNLFQAISIPLMNDKHADRRHLLMHTP